MLYSIYRNPIRVLLLSIFLTGVHPVWALSGLDQGREVDTPFQAAVAMAHQRLIQWLAKRSLSLVTMKSAMFGPSLDKTYFYRLGENEQWDVESLGDRLAAKKQELESQGFPQTEINELELVGLANNQARAMSAPNVIRCAKHFPGGDERIELTEKTSILFSSIEESLEFLKPFRDVLRLPTAPDCIMMAHARYRHEVFQASRKQSLGPLLPDLNFEELPASINPGIISYLKNQMEFRGVILTDYALMGAFFEAFKNLPPQKDVMTQMAIYSVYAATYAGVDLIPSVTFRDPYCDKGLKYLEDQFLVMDPEVLNEWNLRLGDWLLEFSQKIGAPLTKAEVDALSLANKIYLKAPPFFETPKKEFSFVTKDLNPAFAKQLKIYAFGKDVWNRSGVMTLLQRQFIVEGLNHHHYAAPPTSAVDEKRWFLELFANSEFKRNYQKIKWNSPQVIKVFGRLLDQTYRTH